MAIILTPHTIRPYSGPQAALAALVCEALPHLQGMSEIQDYAIPGRDIEIRVVLGGKQECRHWGVPSKALGFHAVCSKEKFDAKDGVYWRDIADTFVVHINLDAAVTVLGTWWDRNQVEDREEDLGSWLITPAHEVLHALEWIKETGGLTPDEVFEQDDMAGIRRVDRAIDVRLNEGRPDGLEDHIEARARNINYAIVPLVSVAKLAAQEWSQLSMDEPVPSAPTP